MTNVVQLRKVEELEATTFHAAWRLITDTMRRRSESKVKCEVLWNREAERVGGQEELLRRLKTYLRDDRDISRTGGPGLQVMLRKGSLEHWVAMESTPRFIPVFPHEAARAALVDFRGEGFCRSYLDPCTVDGTTVVAATQTAVMKLYEVRQVLKEFGFTGCRKPT